ncbi:hypothetical protein EYF80_066911 [Liparis tanakae]|uniref:Uncharacterized protein n=1 Tax=Liparis tanakae TaxID=230148 RepID=A0A4Z2E2L3_9TELE|nr:hypothetical protein EYF80_066911 [Liparis tanakae]
MRRQAGRGGEEARRRGGEEGLRVHVGVRLARKHATLSKPPYLEVTPALNIGCSPTPPPPGVRSSGIITVPTSAAD